MFAAMTFAGTAFAGLSLFAQFRPWLGMEANRATGWRIQRI
jgi:hypothetical protein